MSPSAILGKNKKNEENPHSYSDKVVKRGSQAQKVSKGVTKESKMYPESTT